MNRDEIILIGYSGHAFVVVDAIYSCSGKIKGYCDSKMKENNPFGLTYLGTESEELLRNQNWFIAIGDNHIRRIIFEKYKDIGKAIYVKHPSGIVGAKCDIGRGTYIGAAAILNPLVKIGDGCIINTAAIIEHECSIGNFTHIAPGAVLAGNVKVGKGSFVGANSVVKQGIHIGDNVIIGAGSVVLKDVADNTTIVGNPGRKI